MNDDTKARLVAYISSSILDEEDIGISRDRLVKAVRRGLDELTEANPRFGSEDSL